ncbi:MAG: hypothetical protein JW839_16025, partial [Candidatus Lokiarchaeota archaeon]|nr:hypothetical protein [Candidatus Lokiarchaeota archaeon]
VGAFVALLAIGVVLMLAWPLFMKLRGIPSGSHGGRSVVARGPVFFVRVGGPIPNGGSACWLVTWGATIAMLALGVIPLVPVYLAGPGSFPDLALQASISSLLSFPGAEGAADAALWLPFAASCGGALVAGLIARKPSKGIAAAVAAYAFTTVFLLFFAILFLAFGVDLNIVWAFIAAQLATRLAGGIGLLVSVPPVLVAGALGGLVNLKKA